MVVCFGVGFFKIALRKIYFWESDHKISRFIVTHLIDCNILLFALSLSDLANLCGSDKPKVKKKKMTLKKLSGERINQTAWFNQCQCSMSQTPCFLFSRQGYAG